MKYLGGINTPTDMVNKGYVDDKVDALTPEGIGAQPISDKVQVINEDSTATQYPSAKAVYDALYDEGEATVSAWTNEVKTLDNIPCLGAFEIQGKTIKWNQMFRSLYPSTSQGISFSFDSSTNLLTIDDTGWNKSNASSYEFNGDAHLATLGHKYAVLSSPHVGINMTYWNGSTYPLIPMDSVFTVTGDGANGRFNLRATSASYQQVGSPYSFHLCLVDLTAIYGSGNEPATVTEFKASIEYQSMVKNGYAPYDAGSLHSVETGGIYRWNQLFDIKPLTFHNQGTIGSFDISTASDGTVSVVGDYSFAAGNNLYSLVGSIAFLSNYGSNNIIEDKSYEVPPGVYVSCSTDEHSSKGARFTVQYGLLGQSASSAIPGSVFIVPEGGRIQPSIYMYSGALSYNEKPMICNLTSIFGAGNEPATYEDFKKTDVYKMAVKDGFAPYDTGSDVIIPAISIETYGRNLLDQDSVLNIPISWHEVEPGEYGGEAIELYQAFRSSTGGMPFDFKANTQYTLSLDLRYVNTYASGNGMDIGFEYTDGTRSHVYTTRSSTYSRYTLTSTAGKTIDKLTFGYVQTGPIRIKDFQIELGDTASPFEPCHVRKSLIPGDGGYLRSANTAHDRLLVERDGSVIANRRVGEVDLGTLNWLYDTSTAKPIFYADISTGRKYLSAGMVTNICAEVYPVLPTAVTSSQMVTYDYKTMAATTRDIKATRLYVIDDAYTTAASFKAAMSGHMLTYELAEESTTELDQIAPIELPTDANILTTTTINTIQKIKHARSIWKSIDALARAIAELGGLL